MAPLTPFITERVWQDLFASTSDVPRSRCTSPPGPRSTAAWSTTSCGPDGARPPARRAGSRGSGDAEGPDPAAAAPRPRRGARVRPAARGAAREVADELNIGGWSPSAPRAHLVDHSAKGNFRALGKRFAKDTPPVAQAIADADAAALVGALRERGRRRSWSTAPRWRSARTRCSSPSPREGWSVVNEQGETVALDLELTPELGRAGLAREAIRLVKEARKTSGLRGQRPANPSALDHRRRRDRRRAGRARGVGGGRGAGDAPPSVGRPARGHGRVDDPDLGLRCGSPARSGRSGEMVRRRRVVTPAARRAAAR